MRKRQATPEHVKIKQKKANIKYWVSEHGGSRFNGENNPDATLTNKQVIEIYYLARKRVISRLKGNYFATEDAPSFNVIADMYGTTKTTVGNIIKQKQWKSVTDLVKDKMDL